MMMVAFGDMAHGIQPGMALHEEQAFGHRNREWEEWCCCLLHDIHEREMQASEWAVYA